MSRDFVGLIQSYYSNGVIEFSSSNYSVAFDIFIVCMSHISLLLNNARIPLDSYEMTKLIRLNALCLKFTEDCKRLM